MLTSAYHYILFDWDGGLACRLDTPAGIQARQLLHELHAAKHVAVISESTAAELALSIRQSQLEDAFELVVSRHDVAHPAPNPEALERALDQMGGHKEAAVMISNCDKDILAAHNAGIDSILVSPPEHRRSYRLGRPRHRPTHVVASFNELRALLS